MSDHNKIDYRNHLITIEQDDSNENPLEEWGESFIAVVKHGRGRDISDYGSDTFEVPTFSREEIKKHWKEIVESFEIGLVTSIKGFLQEYGTYCFSNYSNIEDFFNDVIYDLFTSEITSTQFKVVATCWDLKDDFAVYTGTGRGYSQSDWHDIVIVKKIEDGSTKEDTAKYCESAAQSYRDYVYGDVHYYSVTDVEGNFADIACGGYFGEYMSEGWDYMIEAAKSEIDESIKQLELKLESA